MSPLSRDPEKRAKQLANLRPGAGAFQPEQPSPALRHGLRTRKPPPRLLHEAADAIVEALADAVPLKGPDGRMLPQFSEAVNAAALLRVQVMRGQNYLGTHGDTDSRGRLRPEVEQLTKTTDRYLAALDRLGATPASYARLGFDVARSAREQQDLALLWAREAVEGTAAREEGNDG